MGYLLGREPALVQGVILTAWGMSGLHRCAHQVFFRIP
jgi:hypothetical protein